MNIINRCVLFVQMFFMPFYSFIGLLQARWSFRDISSEYEAIHLQISLLNDWTELQTGYSLKSAL